MANVSVRVVTLNDDGMVGDPEDICEPGESGEIIVQSPYGMDRYLNRRDATDETFAAFDDQVGLDHLRCVHLNDSKHACGTNRDEHAHVGEGLIGEAGMRAFVNHDAVADVPLVLETLTEDGKSFAWNVERVRELHDGSVAHG